MFINKKAAIIALSCLVFSYGSYAEPDFSKIQPVRKRQQQFFSYLKPAVERNNKEIILQRQLVVKNYQIWKKKQQINAEQMQKVRQLSEKYKLNSLQFNKKGDWDKLLQRIDIIPPSMVLAQAANESAWGTSRFARLGANYFGQWCFTDGCGIVPKKRPQGRHYAVTKFSSAYASIASYMRNLNTNSHYKLFRQLRAQARKKHQLPSGYLLAQGLSSYSERGMAYVNSIRAIISRHKLSQYDIA